MELGSTFYPTWKTLNEHRDKILMDIPLTVFPTILWNHLQENQSLNECSWGPSETLEWTTEKKKLLDKIHFLHSKSIFL